MNGILQLLEVLGLRLGTEIEGLSRNGTNRLYWRIVWVALCVLLVIPLGWICATLDWGWVNLVFIFAISIVAIALWFMPGNVGGILLTGGLLYNLPETSDSRRNRFLAGARDLVERYAMLLVWVLLGVDAWLMYMYLAPVQNNPGIVWAILAIGVVMTLARIAFSRRGGGWNAAPLLAKVTLAWIPGLAIVGMIGWLFVGTPGTLERFGLPGQYQADSGELREMIAAIKRQNEQNRINAIKDSLVEIKKKVSRKDSLTTKEQELLSSAEQKLDRYEKKRRGQVMGETIIKSVTITSLASFRIDGFEPGMKYEFTTKGPVHVMLLKPNGDEDHPLEIRKGLTANGATEGTTAIADADGCMNIAIVGGELHGYKVRPDQIRLFFEKPPLSN